MVDEISIMISIIAIAIAGFSLWNAWKARKLNEKTNKMARIIDRIKLYSDIAYSNHWNWLPDECKTDSQGKEYREYLHRFLNYYGLVDSEIKEDYKKVVDWFTNGYKQIERDQVWKIYDNIRSYARNRIIELSQELRAVENEKE